jgi:hypothetical protein
MNILKSSTLLIPAVALALITLTGCSTDSATTDPGVNLNTPNNAGSAHYSDLPETDPKAQAFISQFKAGYPELAGDANRPDRYVLKNGTGLCAELDFQKRHGTEMTLEDMKKFVIPRVVAGSVPRKATDAEADGIAKLAVNTICPEFSGQLQGEIKWN